MGEEATGA